MTLMINTAVVMTVAVSLIMFGYIMGGGRGEETGFIEGYHQGFIDEHLDIHTPRRCAEQRNLLERTYRL